MFQLVSGENNINYPMFQSVSGQNNINYPMFQFVGGQNNINYPMFQDGLFLDISLLRDSIISSALNFVFYPFYCNLKGKYCIRRNKDSEKSICMQNQYFFYF